LKWHEHSSIRTFIASDTFISKPDHCGKSLHVRKSISLVIKWEGIGLWWNAHAIIWKRITIINHSFLPYMNYSYWFFFFSFTILEIEPRAITCYASTLHVSHAPSPLAFSLIFR
jgi:hypothetical protein